MQPNDPIDPPGPPPADEGCADEVAEFRIGLSALSTDELLKLWRNVPHDDAEYVIDGLEEEADLARSGGGGAFEPSEHDGRVYDVVTILLTRLHFGEPGRTARRLARKQLRRRR